jgi:hypothetical protein
MLHQDDNRKKVCLLAGPESSGTRIFNSVLSEHPLILGTPEAMGHLDILDPVWQALEQNDIQRAKAEFPNPMDKTCILTRRSLPHAVQFTNPARYMDFANINGLHKLCRRINCDLILLITTRSAIPNLSSWALNRLSADHSYARAENQYYESYLYLFNFIRKARVNYYLVSLEALLLDGQNYVQSIFKLLNLPHCEVKLDLHTDVNTKYYLNSFEYLLEQKKLAHMAKKTAQEKGDTKEQSHR